MSTELIERLHTALQQSKAFAYCQQDIEDTLGPAWETVLKEAEEYIEQEGHPEQEATSDTTKEERVAAVVEGTALDTLSIEQGKADCLHDTSSVVLIIEEAMVTGEVSFIKYEVSPEFWQALHEFWSSVEEEQLVQKSRKSNS